MQVRGAGSLLRALSVLAALIGPAAAVSLPAFSPFFLNWFRSQPASQLANVDGVPFQLPQRRADEGHFLTPNDFAVAETAPVEHPTAEQIEAMSLPSLFEGDIAGVAFEDRVLRDATDIIRLPQYSALNLGTYPDKLWPGAEVPYQLEEGLEEHQRVALAQAFDEYKNKTCVRFVPRTHRHYDYIYIKRNKHLGCSSYVGRAGGNQTISLEVGKCFTKGIVAHELMHSLGFFHEHSRTDRDSFVRIVEDNVKPGMLRNFEKYPHKIIDTLEMPYDYGSVMHYHKLAFSKNGKATIEPKDPKAEIGQRYRLSEIDAKKVNKLYQCDKTEPEVEPEEETSGEDKDKPTTKKPRKNRWTLGTRGPGGSECRDLNEHCEMWSEIGHCKWSEKYMNHYCQASCGLCNLPTSTPTTTAAIFTTTNGFTTPQPVVTTTTKATTTKSNVTKKEIPEKKSTEKKAEEEKGRCLDQNLFCGYWSRIGECKSESKFMKIFCKRSCDLC